MAGLGAAQTSAARNLTAQENAYSGSQTQAQRGLGASENVLGAVAPLANTPYALNPAEGTYTGSGLPSGTSALDAVKNAGTLSGTQSGAAAVAGAGGNIAAQNAITSGTTPTNAAASLYSTTYPPVGNLNL